MSDTPRRPLFHFTDMLRPPRGGEPGAFVNARELRVEADRVAQSFGLYPGMVVTANVGGNAVSVRLSKAASPAEAARALHALADAIEGERPEHAPAVASADLDELVDVVRFIANRENAAAYYSAIEANDQGVDLEAWMKRARAALEPFKVGEFARVAASGSCPACGEGGPCSCGGRGRG